MFSSLRDWCTIPLKINLEGPKKPNGQKGPSDVKDVNGYVVSNIETYITSTGEERKSSSQIYVPAECGFNLRTARSVEFDTETFIVNAVKCFYDGTSGHKSLWVIYL